MPPFLTLSGMGAFLFYGGVMGKNKTIDSENFRRTINRLAHEVVEKNVGTDNLVIVGIRTRGEYLARRIAKKIEEIEGKSLQVGILDITLYRDDLRGRLDQPQLKSTDILFDINGKVILLVDDVLFTGRTIRSALNALTDLGRPALIELLVLIGVATFTRTNKPMLIASKRPVTHNASRVLKVNRLFTDCIK